MTKDAVGVIGGGIVGLAVAREVMRRRSDTHVVLFEKEDSLGRHQTGHNSGVVHAGLYYKPGSLKAQLCSRGRALLRDYCAEHALPYDECGKLVVAVEESELPRLTALARNANANRVPGLRQLGASEIAEVEPHTTGLAALYSPETAITDFGAVCERLGDEIVAGHGEIRLSTEVAKITPRRGAVDVIARDVRHEFSHVIICAGLQSDRLGRLAGGTRTPRIVPFKGEYMTVTSAKQHYVRGMVYPVPDPQYPFLGVHFTRTVDGGLEVGPNAFLSLSRTSYNRWAVNPRDVGSTVGWPGFWRFAGEHWRTGFDEIRGVLSKKTYMSAAQRYVPDITAGDVSRGRLGLRAQALDRHGALVDDFVIEHLDRVTSIRNAPSPAATSSLAIAEHIVDQIDFPR